MPTELEKACEVRLKIIRDIFVEHKKGKSTRQIASKHRIAESYVVSTVKKGIEAAITEQKKMYGINDDNVNSSGMIPSTHEYLCECGTTMLDGKPEKGENDYVFRTLDCPKCKKHYINPIDARKYLYSS